MADYHDQDWLVNVPLYGASGEISDRIYSSGGRVYLSKSINASLLDPTKNLSNQQQAIYATPELIDITDTPTGQAYKSLQTYYPHTHIYSTAQNEVKPTVTASIKEF